MIENEQQYQITQAPAEKFQRAFSRSCRKVSGEVPSCNRV